MARQEILLGYPSSVSQDNVTLSTKFIIDRAFISNPDGRNVTLLSFFLFQSGAIRFNINSATRELRPEVEIAENLFTFQCDGLEDFSLHGPAHPDNEIDVDRNPYSWVPPDRDAFRSWIGSIRPRPEHYFTLIINTDPVVDPVDPVAPPVTPGGEVPAVRPSRSKSIWDELTSWINRDVQEVFGIPVMYMPVGSVEAFTVQGHFNEAFEVVDGDADTPIVTTQPVLDVILSHFPRASQPREGDRLVIGEGDEARTFRVVRKEIDGNGGALLLLHKVVA